MRMTEPGSRPKRGAVIIPAHNEGALIRRCADSLLAGADDGQVHVVVVCNGCTDDTAAQARLAGPGVEVVETPVASKPGALNLGDSVTDAFPRAYVDGDVTVTPGAALAVLAALDDGPALLAYPEHRFDLTGCSWLVRRFHGAWVRTPFYASGYMSAGFYALSRAGRARFDRFPGLIADDMFVHSLFAPSEKLRVPGHVVVQRLPRTIGEIVNVQVRHETGNRELRRHFHAVGVVPAGNPEHAGRAWVSDSLRRPGGAVDLAVFAGVKVVVKLVGHWRSRFAPQAPWNRDESTRGAAVAGPRVPAREIST